MKDGMGRKIRNTRDSIRKALREDTNYVSSDDDRLVMTYDEDNEEIDISINEIPLLPYYVEDGEMEQAITHFIELLSEHNLT